MSWSLTTITLPATEEIQTRTKPVPESSVRRSSSGRPAPEPKRPPAWRYEFKYRVPRHVRTGLTVDLRALVDPDRHAGPDGFYTVRSLYLDSPGWLCFYEKRAGAPHRHKLRVRTYLEDGTPGAPIKLEVKHRNAARIRKDVTPLSLTEYQDLRPVLRSPQMLEARWLGRSAPLDAFFRIKQTYAMTPVVNVQFRRQAFVARADRRVRITLDDRLVARRARDLYDPLPAPHVGLAGDSSILEVKVDRAMPFWMHRLIAKYRLQVESMSKYCYAVAHGPFGLEGVS